MNKSDNHSPMPLFPDEKILFIQLFKNAPEAIVITNPRARVIRINSEFNHSFGYNEEDIRGRILDHQIDNTVKFKKKGEINAQIADC